MVFYFKRLGGGQQLRRVGFGAKNGDCGARAAVTYAKYAPLHTLAKPHFYHPNPTASDSAPENKQSPDSISTILESQDPLKSPTNLESSFDNNAPFPSLRALAQDKAWQSTSTAPKVDSSTATILNELRIFDKTTQKVGEPQTQASLDSRNEAQNLKTPAKDSRISKETSANAERCPLFCDEKSGFCECAQGRALGVRNRRAHEAIHDLSRKAESSKETKPLICIPTYNEAKNIAPLLREIFSLFPKIHILIIDDNSTDGTQEILASLSRSYPNLHILKRAGKLGLASAYIDGFLWGLKSGFSHFIQMDADFSHHPRYLSQTLHNLSCFDVIINSRNIIGGGVVGWGLSRKILSRFGSLYARLWLGTRVMDFTGGFNAYSARALRAINLHSIKSSGYCFQIEMKYRAYKAGLRLLELPIIFEDRIAGKSKMSKTIVLEALWRTPFLRLRVKRAER